MTRSAPNPGGSRRPPHRRGESGYNLALLMVLVTALNVLVAAALPTWTSIDQRHKEEELIFRGLQYAEAIRVFQGRFGRLPVRLEELVEVEPRSIRQLWADPMTGEQRWGLIFASAGGGQQAPDQQGGQQELAGGNAPGSSFGSRSGGDRDEVTTGPIVGVHSLADGESIKVFNGAERYSEWHFTVDLIVQRMGGGGGGPGGGPGGPGSAGPGTPTDANGRPVQPQQGAGTPGAGGPAGAALVQPGQPLPDLSSRWIGRPWPPDLEAATGSGPGGLQDGGLPGQGGGVNQGGPGQRSGSREQLPR